jgi:hypothetical protein
MEFFFIGNDAPPSTNIFDQSRFSQIPTALSILCEAKQKSKASVTYWCFFKFNVV